MKILIQVLENETQVRIRKPVKGNKETGIWLIIGRVLGSGTADPAYEIQSQLHGRRRIMRRSRLRVLRKGKSR